MLAKLIAKRRQPEGEAQAHLRQGAAPTRTLPAPCGPGQDCSTGEEGLMQETVFGLPSGVQYKVISNGTGRSPQPGDSVIVSYTGLLPDGTEFTSADTGSDSEAFGLNEAILGLQDVLQYMEEGARWEVYIPSEMAFPEPGPWGGEDVIFVIELHAVMESQPTSTAMGQAEQKDSAPVVRLVDQQAYQEVAAEADITEPEPVHTAETGAGKEDRPRQRMGTEAQTFFEDNARQEGVVSLPSGLQYRVLHSGNGSGLSPGASDSVVLNYRGSFLDGREFDRSEGDAQFNVSEVIPGWREALQQMEEGDQWELYIPPSLAHRGGIRKRGALGMQPLIYQVELVSIAPDGARAAD
jgi:FKBP-type peptidyl-prolyl cis-trans isomerase